MVLSANHHASRRYHRGKGFGTQGEGIKPEALIPDLERNTLNPFSLITLNSMTLIAIGSRVYPALNRSQYSIE